MMRSSRVPSAMAAGVLGLAVGGCENKGKDSRPAAASNSRVNAVVAEKKEVNLDDLCEVRKPSAEAVPFAFPALADGAAAGGLSDGWRWINIWATWCKPCVEELPMLAEWRERLKANPVGLDLVFLSVDGEASLVTEFTRQHPKTPSSLRIASADNLGPWLRSLGLDETSVLPIHMFVDPKGKLRCVRMGPVSEPDFDTVKALVAQG